MNIYLEKENCIACGLCQAIAQNIFDYDEDGIVKFLTSEKHTLKLPLSDELVEAIKRCPVHAIHRQK
jgi:ferredoxin